MTRCRHFTYFMTILPAMVLLSCLPEAGTVNGVTLAAAAEINDKRWGASQSAPLVLRIEVEENSPLPPEDVGHLVKTAFFYDTPPFSFNVSFSCNRREYTNPASIWFNVFLGYYEIEVSKEDWGRPFGYQQSGEIAIDDIIRIGKADWNYFSNYVYGVPLDVVRRLDAGETGRGVYLGQVTIGSRRWDFVELSEVMVSAYVAAGDAKKLVTNDPILTPIWRRFFGAPHEPHPGFPTSFFPTRMRAKAYISYKEAFEPRSGTAVYRTYVFGGTSNDVYQDVEENERFLDHQLKTLREVILADYSDLGF